MSTDTVEKTSNISLVENEQEYIAKTQKTLKGLEESVPKGKKESKEKDLQKEKSEKCPFPTHKWYAALWRMLTQEQQKEMKKNIKITADGKIEMIALKKKFSVLEAKDNGKDIFHWEYVDKYHKKGVSWVTYMTGNGWIREAKTQEKKLFRTEHEINDFIKLFPWDNILDKMSSFVILFGLSMSGYLDTNFDSWEYIGLGYVTLSDAVSKNHELGAIVWNYDIRLSDPEFADYPLSYARPFVVFENINK